MQQGENNTSSDFSKIEPYAEQNINDALKRILANPVFQVMIDYLFPQESHAKLRTDLSQATTSLEFQTLFMYTGLKSVLKKTTPKGLSFRGSEYVIDGKAKTYISNHRDILLDSALLQTILVDLGLETSEISFGDNLIVNDFINDFGRINRMFTVFREGPPREMLQNAKTLSAYINMTLKQKKRSIWIAQRKGRAKNGIDKTDLGVLKMLTSSSDDTLKEAVRNLDIVPLSVSYEWEPCDAMKIREMVISERTTYQKAADEDMKSVVHGIINQKGGIHISFCQPVNQVLDQFDLSQGNNPFLNQIIDFMDAEIIKNFKLWPSNYYAFDVVNNSSEYADYYNLETIEYFNKRLNKAIEVTGENESRAKELFIKLYANPIYSRQKLGFDITQ